MKKRLLGLALVIAILVVQLGPVYGQAGPVEDRLVEEIEEVEKVEEVEEIEEVEEVEEIEEQEEEVEKDKEEVGARLMEGDFDYEDLDGGLRITNYRGDLTEKADIIIPAAIDGRRVLEIGDGESPLVKNAVRDKRVKGDIIVEAEDVVLNNRSFANIDFEIYGNELKGIYFNEGIGSIGDEVFAGAKPGLIHMPDDMEGVVVGENIFKGAFIDEFTVPYNFKTADKSRVNKSWVVIKRAIIKETIDQSVAYSLGSPTINSNFDLVVDESTRELGNLGLKRMNVNEILLPVGLERLDVDSFEGIVLRKNLAILGQDIEVDGGRKTMADVLDKMHIEKSGEDYNPLTIHIHEGSSLEEDLKDGYENILSYLISDWRHISSDYDPNHYLVDRLIPNLDGSFNNTLNVDLSSQSFNYSLVSDYYDLEKQIEEMRISKKFKNQATGQEMAYQFDREKLDERLDYREDEDYIYVENLGLKSFFMDFNLLNNYYEDRYFADDYRLDIAVDYRMTIKSKEGEVYFEDEATRDYNLENVSYLDLGDEVTTLNYHSIGAGDLLNLEDYNLASSSIEFLYESPWYPGPLVEGFTNVAAFEKDNLFKGQHKDSWYNSYDFSLHGLEKTKIESKGISKIRGNDYMEVGEDDIIYPKTDSSILSLDKNREGRDLGYIMIGDYNLLNNAKGYFEGSSEESPVFKVFRPEGEDVSIEDYKDELSILNRQMLLIYGDFYSLKVSYLDQNGRAIADEKSYPIAEGSSIDPEKYSLDIEGYDYVSMEKEGDFTSVKGDSSLVFNYRKIDSPTKPVDPPTKPVDPPTKPVHPPTKPVDPPTKPVDPERPITPELNKEDHFAYIQGYQDGSIRPEEKISREEVSAIFFRLLEENYRETIRTMDNDFKDVAASRWSNKHISTLAEGGILEGYPDGSFRPGNNISRGELAAIVSRFDDLEETDKSIFSDVSGHWAEKYIDSAVEKGWVNGYEDGSFRPDQDISRAEVVTLINRVLERETDLEHMYEDRKEYKDLDKDKWYYEAFQEAINSHDYERLDSGKEKWLGILEIEIEM